jgi:hypothetical protein
MYLEAENVSCSVCSWGDSGTCAYLFQKNSSAPSEQCVPGPVHTGQDLSGGDYKTEVLSGGNYAEQCQTACCRCVCVWGGGGCVCVWVFT